MYKIIICAKYNLFCKNITKTIKIITHLDVKCNSTMIFNLSRELNRVKNQREIYGVRSQIEVPIMSRSGIGQSNTLNGHSSGLK